MPNLAQQAGAELNSLNRKIIEDIPDKILKAGTPIRIYNVGPWSWLRNMASHGPYTIPACQPGKRHSPPLIIPSIKRETYPDSESTNKMRNRFEDGMDLALAIIGEGPFQSKEQGFRKFGVFITTGEAPTETELKDAEEALRQWRIHEVQEADNFYNQGPMKYENIVGEHRAAAVALNIDRPWLHPISPQIACPGCGEKIDPGIAFHASPYCGTIINEEKYKKLKRVGQQPPQTPHA
jgi:hypothetical protein